MKGRKTMAHIPSTPEKINGATNGSSNKKKLTGKELAAWLAHASILTKLCIAAAWLAGEIDVGNFTIAQVARLLGVKSKQIKAIAELPPEQRAALTNPRRLNGVGHMSNDMIDEFVDRVGAERLWAAIDRRTAPTTIAAE
jgi:hypothetical protein